MYLAGEKKTIIGCQSHPEFDFKYAIQERIWPHVVEKCRRLNDEEIELAKATFAEYDGNDAKLFLSWINDFLRA